MGFLDRELCAELDALESSALKRGLRMLSSGHDTTVECDGRRMLMLASNNYLGLASHPALREAAERALARYGTGAGASRLIAGSLAPLHRLEEHLARFKGTEAALVFGSGFLANIGTISALVKAGDVVLSDELNHASMIDGCRLSRATIRIYKHRDTAHLESQLQESRGARRRLIVTDTVFSMDGDFAPLERIVELARRYEAAVMVDEAHAVGVVGPNGAGLAAKFAFQNEIDAHVGTLSKAIGAYGAYVAGSRALIDVLVNRARSFIYSTALPPAIAAAADAALSLIETQPGLIDRLWDNGRYLRDGLVCAGLNVAPSDTPILPVMVGEPEPALRFAGALLARGIYVIAIRPPTVPAGTARLRVTPTAAMGRQEIDFAIRQFAEAARELALL